MKRILILAGIGGAAAATQSKWLVLAFAFALLATFVYGIFDITQ